MNRDISEQHLDVDYGHYKKPSAKTVTDYEPSNLGGSFRREVNSFSYPPGERPEQPVQMRRGNYQPPTARTVAYDDEFGWDRDRQQ